VIFYFGEYLKIIYKFTCKFIDKESIEMTINDGSPESVLDFNCLMKKCTPDDQRCVEKRLRGLLHYYKDVEEKISSLIVSE